MLSETQVGFFSGFLDFSVNGLASPDEEFARLSRQRQWKEGSKTHKKYQNAFRKLESARPSEDNPSGQAGIQSGPTRVVQPKSERRTAAELTPDWILADVLKELNLGPSGRPEVGIESTKEHDEESEDEDEGVMIGYFDKFPGFDAQKTNYTESSTTHMPNSYRMVKMDQRQAHPCRDRFDQ